MDFPQIQETGHAVVATRRKAELYRPEEGATGGGMLPGRFTGVGGVVREREILTVEDLLLYLRRHWKTSLLIAGPLAALMLIALAGRTPFYRSETHLKVVLTAASEMPFRQVDLGENSTVFVVNNHKLGLTTRAFQEYFFEHLDPQDRSDFLEDRGFKKPLVASAIGAVKGTVRSVKSGMAALFRGEESAAPGPDWERDAFLKKWNEGAFGIAELKESHVIRISVSGPNRDLAARLANQYALLYADYLANEEREAARSAFQFLSQRESEYRQIAMESRQVLNQFRLENEVTDTSPMDVAGNDEIRSLNEERARVRVAFTMAEAVLAQEEEARRSGRSLMTIAEIATAAGVQESDRRWKEKEREYESMRRLYGEDHVQVRNARQDLVVLGEMLEVETEREVAQLVNRRDSAEQRLAALEGQLDGVLRGMASKDQRTLEFSSLVARAESDQKTYDEILTKLNLAKVQMELPRTASVHVIDRAVAAEKPYRPNTGVAVVMSGFMFLGMFLGIPLTLGLSEDMSQRFGIRLPVVHRRVPEEVSSVPVLAATSNLDLLAKVFSVAPAREGLFRLAAALDRKAEGRKERIILMTSVGEGEGKSFLASALGGVYCSQGHRTLIVECNFRNPSMGVWFPHLQGGTNLVEWLEGHGEDGFELDYQRHGDSELYVLAARGWAMKPDELLGQACFRQLLHEAMRKFDRIILDGPHDGAGAEVGVLFERATEVVLVNDRQVSGFGDISGMLKKVDAAALEKVAGVLSNRTGSVGA